MNEFSFHLGEEDRIYVDHVGVGFYDSAKAQLGGEVLVGDKTEIDLNGAVTGIMLDEVLPPDAAKNCLGK